MYATSELRLWITLNNIILENDWFLKAFIRDSTGFF